MSAESICVVSLDVDTLGPKLGRHALMAIGYYIDNKDENKKGRISFLPGEFKEDENCSREYWAMHSEKKQQLLKEAVEPKVGMLQFVKMFTELESKYETHIIVDNGKYDVSWIDYYLSHYLDHTPICRTMDGTRFRGVHHLYEWVHRCVRSHGLKGIWWTDRIEEYAKAQATAVVRKDHWPENDAHWNYLFTAFMFRTILEYVMM